MSTTPVPDFGTDAQHEEDRRVGLARTVAALREAVQVWQSHGDALHEMSRSGPTPPTCDSAEWFSTRPVVSVVLLDEYQQAAAELALRAYGIAGHFRREVVQLQADMAADSTYAEWLADAEADSHA